jgi:hypothetical protein
MGRVAHRILVGVSTLAAALILVCGFGLWRLTQGSIDLDLLIPHLQEALNRSGDGLRVALSGGRLSIDRATGQLVLQIEGVRVARSDGEPLAAFPELSADFSLRSLLRGNIAPTRLVIQRPVLRLVRDEAGAIRFRLDDRTGDTPSFGPEILADWAGQQGSEKPFGLMRRVAIRDATIVLDDRQTGRRWQADHAAATVERTVEGLTGDLSLAFAAGARKPELHTRYRYSANEHTLDLTLEIGAVEPAALASLAPELAPLAFADFPVSGTLATRVNLSGPWSEGMRIDLHFGAGTIKSELLPEGSLALQQGVLRAAYAPETGELRLAKLEFDLGGGSAITFKGSLEGVTPAMIAGSDAPPTQLAGKLGIVLANVPVAKFESLWPPALSRGGRRWVLANVHEGVLDEAVFELDLQVDAKAYSAEIVSAHGAMRYRDATINYFQGLAPARKVSGTATLEDKRLVFKPTGGSVKSVQVTGGSLQITDLGAPIEWLTVDLAFTGPVQDILETINAKPLRYAHEIGIDPGRVAGRTEANVHFKLPLLQELKIDQVQYGVKANLSGAAIADVAMKRNLTDGNLALEITRPGAHLQGNARFDGVPLNIDANLFFKPKDGAQARYRIALTLNDEQRRRLSFDFLPDRLTGPIGVDLTYRVIDAAHAEAEANLDLSSAALSIAEAGWKKPPGAPATAKLAIDLQDERVTRLRQIEVKAAGLDGRFVLALAPDTGRIERVDIQRLVLGNDDATGLVMRRLDGGWRVDLRGPSLDLSHWIKDLAKPGTRQNSPADPPLQIEARLGRLILGPQREVHDLTAQLSRAGVDWQSVQIEARFADGHRLSLHTGSEAGPRSLTFRSDDLGSTLGLFDITSNIVGGRVTITGQVSDASGKAVVRGHIEGEDYSLVRAPVFARMLSLPSFSGAGSLLAGSGIPFSTLRGDFVYSDNHVVLDNLLAYGGAIGVTANGIADLARDRLDLQGTIVPAYALNSIIGNIPVIGSLLLGGEGQGLFAANYRVTGAASDPQVSVNPLSALAPGFLRRLFQPNFGLPPPVQQSLGVQ